MSDRPLVTVTHPRIPVVAVGGGYPDPDDRTEAVLEALVLSCSEHGELTDWASLPERHQLQYLARRHADVEHDGDVDTEGWTR